MSEAASVYRSFSHDVTAAIFVYKKNPVGIELFSHVKTFFLFQAICKAADHVTDCMATEVDTILEGTSSFYNKRMRQVSSLIAFFLNKLIPCTFNYIACENIRFSSLFAAGDVSRGGTRETSPAAKSEQKRMFSQAINCITI